MAAPVLVRGYTNGDASSSTTRSVRGSKALPPISAFAFADILRTADSPDFQAALDGIAEICAKNRMSLADEYSSHMPPLGEITTTTSVSARPHLLRPNMRTALTSVPEGSSGSSEGSSPKKRKRSGLFTLGWQQYEQNQSLRRIRIGSMGRSAPVTSTTALGSSSVMLQEDNAIARSDAGSSGRQLVPPRTQTKHSQAASSLQRLLARAQSFEAG
ncbi:hypothetical protein LTR37_016847 [Vermiconidia calcicola]|uniref:Uncharacterized protein n=1 Tax=Vermiconidia calcicola TaxID=1690605 RepID=A0ACC3MPC7_9PEZI|nr:hypothetical protein LTR37_016847 [Vermiconidia calcicola]